MGSDLDILRYMTIPTEYILREIKGTGFISDTIY